MKIPFPLKHSDIALWYRRWNSQQAEVHLHQRHVPLLPVLSRIATVLVRVVFDLGQEPRATRQAILARTLAVTMKCCRDLTPGRCVFERPIQNFLFPLHSALSPPVHR